MQAGREQFNICPVTNKGLNLFVSGIHVGTACWHLEYTCARHSAGVLERLQLQVTRPAAYSHT
jgi:hypothetical protein